MLKQQLNVVKSVFLQNTASPFITTPHGNPNFNPVKVRGSGVSI